MRNPVLRNLLLTGLLAGGLCCQPGLARDITSIETGQRVVLNDDGTWQAAEEERYTTTSGGNPVLLNPDGTWTVLVAEPPDSRSLPEPPLLPPNSGMPGYTVTRVEVVRKETKRSKNKKSQTRTLFYVELYNPGPKNLQINPDRKILASDIIVRSSRGTVFPVLNVVGCAEVIAVDAVCQIVVVADNSPSWFGIDTLDLQLLPEALGNPTTQILSFPYQDVRRRQVKKFTY